MWAHLSDCLSLTLRLITALAHARGAVSQKSALSSACIAADSKKGSIHSSNAFEYAAKSVDLDISCAATPVAAACDNATAQNAPFRRQKLITSY